MKNTQLSVGAVFTGVYNLSKSQGFYSRMWSIWTSEHWDYLELYTAIEELINTHECTDFIDFIMLVEG